MAVKIVYIDRDGKERTLDNLITSKNFFLDVSRGDIVGIDYINKFGRNPDCNQAASATAVNIGRSIWDGGIAGAVNWLEPTQSRVHQLKSTDVNDTSDGSGARTVQIYGLDFNYALLNETKTLNGTTNVPTSSFTMIYRMIVRSAGATGWNEGTITATADGDTTVTAQITIGNNQTLMTQFMVPANMKGYMTHYYSSIHKTGGAAKFADVFLISKVLGEVWRLRDATDLSSDGAAYVNRKFEPYKAFKERELVQVVANPSADAQDISAGFDLILVDD